MSRNRFCRSRFSSVSFHVPFILAFIVQDKCSDLIGGVVQYFYVRAFVVLTSAGTAKTGLNGLSEGQKSPLFSQPESLWYEDIPVGSRDPIQRNEVDPRPRTPKYL